ncbi:hypothetical protein EYF80_049065 [Liparis tanakae]|uniref:Uncharacterized protein n=1 Tax=Liparis tanakae TaxID=230148 RepID=A0A4Z2FIJ7_9TELE|nr:hypothetical protein EYF80_049065 [Liparis tanakae]
MNKRPDRWTEAARASPPPRLTGENLSSCAGRSALGRPSVPLGSGVLAAAGKEAADVSRCKMCKSVTPPPTSPVSYSSSPSFSCSSTTLAKLLALEEERERSCASGMDGALQHIARLHTWVTPSAHTAQRSPSEEVICAALVKRDSGVLASVPDRLSSEKCVPSSVLMVLGDTSRLQGGDGDVKHYSHFRLKFNHRHCDTTSVGCLASTLTHQCASADAAIVLPSIIDPLVSKTAVQQELASRESPLLTADVLF